MRFVLCFYLFCLTSGINAQNFQQSTQDSSSDGVQSDSSQQLDERKIAPHDSASISHYFIYPLNPDPKNPSKLPHIDPKMIIKPESVPFMPILPADPSIDPHMIFSPSGDKPFVKDLKEKKFQKMK
ncbi:MAG: hypothetical protein DWQ05_14300 [Calditrichaeota bacterium]|nr:MAG: hypothetical protein DWQ05_14300 [Calditrichota bacterium]